MIYADTEYNDHAPLLWCSWEDGDDPDHFTTFNLRTKDGVDGLRSYIKMNQSKAFATYTASAEITTLLRLDIDVSKLKIVDLMAESRMLTLSHDFKVDGFNKQSGDLLSQLKFICGLDVKEASKEKDRMRDLILSKNEWTDAEWSDIIKYCKQDVKHLPKLFDSIKLFHDRFSCPLQAKDLIDRGEYVRQCAEMDYASKGFPVYEPYLKSIYANKDRSKKLIIEGLPPEWRNCYIWDFKKGRYKFNVKSLEKLVENKGWVWKRTPSGQCSTDQDDLKELRERIPEVNPFYQARKSLSTLNSADLSGLIQDGYIKTKTFAYSASTGRNGLKPKHGYLLNLPKWMRKCITVHPGMALLSFDYSQQEIAVAAALSGDEELKKAYNSGDIYLELGKMAGIIPQDGTKQTHSVQRQMMKALQLGLAYGKGKNSLGDTIAPLLAKTMTESEARLEAEAIFTWHKHHFKVYWAWIEKQVNYARDRKYIASLDNWKSWVDRLTPKTRLLNFPSQANGAYMLREAVRACYMLWKSGELPPLLCSQHDALYFSCKVEDIDKTVDLVKAVMEAASIHTIGMSVRVDSNVYTYENPYEPDGFTEEHQKLWDLVV